MKVIGAGLPRTGTLSQKVALEMLGFGPCYHMVNVLTNLPLSKQWERAIDDERRLGRDLRRARGDGRLARRRSSIASSPTPIRMPRSCSAPATRRRGRRACGTRSGTCSTASRVMGYISQARERVDPDWQAYIRI